jgi:DNA helicase-2/ATP-dependent DNA helicase PcrA
MGTFETSYEQLNKSQRQAVDTIEGPVLVIAGPGTGKTQLLGMRVANILKSTDTEPSAVLCLTFTNKAATNMRDRLLSRTGPASRDVSVRTFHSFAAEVMNLYPDYFWNGARLTVAPDAVQIEIIESILSSLPFANPLSLKFAGKFTSVHAVQQALRLTKEAGLTPEKLRAIITYNLAYIATIEEQLITITSPTLSAKRLPALQAAIAELPEQAIDEALTPLLSLGTVIRESLDYAIEQDMPSGKTSNTSKWKQRFVQSVTGKKGMFDERRRNEWWLAVASVYEQYRQALHTRGYYDYADMLVEVISQLEAHPDLRASIQERYLYVLIDEFQDTNAAQLRLAHLVADHPSTEGKPNIMAVGDDDQSIYKFNGAELNNMLSFQRTYPTTKLFVLTDNYRSTQAVLDTAKQVIELAHDRLVTREPSIVKTLSAVNAPAARSIIQQISYPTREQQLSATARQLKKELTSTDHSIAVLARSHESLRSLAGLLNELDVPVHYEQSNDILSHEAVIQIVQIAKVIVAIQTGDESTVNHLLPTILRHPMWHIEPLELWKFVTTQFGQSEWLASLIAQPNSTLQEIGHWLLWLAGEADRQPLPVMLEYIIGLRASEHLTSPLKTYYLADKTSDKFVRALSAIRILQSTSHEFAQAGNEHLTDFVRLTNVMRDNRQIVADESPFVSQARAVELYSVHKAKGLEFDSVYVIDAVEKNWQPTSGGRKPPANLPLQPNGDDYDDYVRLLYVALTRAKQDITVTSYRIDGSGNDILTTPLIHEAIPDSKKLSSEEAGESLVVLQENLHWPRIPVADEQQLLHSKLDNYSLSATHFLNFLDVTHGGPAHFLEQNLLNLPQARTASQAFGTAVHAALESAQKQVNAQQFKLANVVGEYEKTLLAQHLPLGEFDRYLAHGKNVLEHLFETLDYVLPEGSLPEQSLRNVIVGENIQLGGKLDRIDLPSIEELTIIDYKTGTPLTSFESRDQTKQVKAWRHKTQLAFYIILVSKSSRFKKIPTINSKMVYVEAETPRELERSLEADPETLNRLEQLIEVVWRHIKDLNLPDTSEYSADISGIHQFEEDLLNGKI